MTLCKRCKIRTVPKKHHKYCKECHREIYGDMDKGRRIIGSLIHTKLKMQKK